MFTGDLKGLILRAFVILFSLTVHEFFHGYLAFRMGDNTARDLGRLTLNPLKHLDLFGVLVMIVTQFRFGWAKPVPVNPMNFHHPRRDDIIVSAAGPLSNIGIAAVAAVAFRVTETFAFGAPPALITILQDFVYINLILAFFNLIPLFPLDGSHILSNLLPPRYELTFEQINRFAPLILILLLVTGAIGFIIGPPVGTLYRVFLGF